MKPLRLTRGLTTWVDNNTYQWASKHKWYASQEGKRAAKAYDHAALIRSQEFCALNFPVLKTIIRKKKQ